MLEREILELVPPDRNVSIEREVWPRLVGEGLYGFPSQSYWLDIGTPERYLQGTFDILEGNVRTAVHERLGDSYLSVADGAQVLGRAIPPAVIERGRASRRAPTSAASWCSAGRQDWRGRTVERAVILDGTEIGEDCTLRDCIVAAGCRIGEGTQINGAPCSARGSRWGRDNVITGGARIFPVSSCPTARSSSRSDSPAEASR